MVGWAGYDETSESIGLLDVAQGRPCSAWRVLSRCRAEKGDYVKTSEAKPYGVHVMATGFQNQGGDPQAWQVPESLLCEHPGRGLALARPPHSPFLAYMQTQGHA